MEEDKRKLGPLPYVPPGVIPVYLAPAQVDPTLWKQVYDGTVKSATAGRAPIAPTVPAPKPMPKAAAAPQRAPGRPAPGRAANDDDDTDDAASVTSKASTSAKKRAKRERQRQRDS